MTIRHSTAVLLFVCAATAHSMFAAPCEQAYSGFVQAMTGAHLPEGAAKRISAKVNAATRIYGSGVPQSGNRAAAQMNAAAAALAALTGIPDESRDPVRTAMTELSTCMATPLATTSASFRVAIADAISNTRKPAGAGVSILVDGEEVTKTGADGTAAGTVAVGTHNIAAQQFPNLFGSTGKKDLAAGGPTIDITMQAEADLAIPAELDVVEAPDGVLSKNFRNVTLQMVDDSGSVIRLRSIDMLTVTSEAGGVDVAKYFTVRGDGAVTLKNEHAFAAAILKSPDPLTIRLRGRDAAGLEYRGSVQFSVGRYTASAQIVPSPGASIDRGSLYVVFINDDTGVSTWSRTGANGLAAFPQLPFGRYLVRCDLVQGNKRYLGLTAVMLDADNKTFRVPLVAIGSAAKSATASTTSDGAVVIDTGHGKVTMKPAQPPPGPYYRRDRNGTWYREDEDRRQKVLTFWFRLMPDGSFQPVHVHETVWPEPLQSETEEELTARRLDDQKNRPDRLERVVNVRIRDHTGQIIYRTNAWVQLAEISEGALYKNPRPSLMFHVPVSAETIELTGWEAVQDITVDVKTLLSNPQLRTYELMLR